MMKPNSISGWLWAASLALALVLAGFNLWFGDLNQDEGWYLNAARLVAHGKVPYRDFAFTQGPAMAYGYVPAVPLIEALGVAGGRLYTGLLGLIAAGLAAWLAARLSAVGNRSSAALLAFMAVGLNVYQSYFCTVVKTYALGAVLLGAGFLLLTAAGGRRGRAAAALAGACLTLAAATRISAGAAVPAVFLCLVAGRRTLAPWAWFWFGAGAGIAALGVFGPFFLQAREGLIFSLLQYHAGREVGGLVQVLVYKAGFLSRLAQAYYATAAIAALALLARWLIPAAPVTGQRAPVALEDASGAVVRSLWWTVAAVSAVHLTAPFPYDDYQAMIFPLFAAGVALLAARAAAGRLMPWALVAAFVLHGAAAFSSPVNQAWFVQGRDRIWWLLKEEPALVRLQRAAATVRRLAPDARVLLTQDTYLAVEAGLDVPAGMEMGPFSYFPDLSTEQARQRRVLNGELLRRTLAESEAPVAAFSGYGLAIRCPEVERLSAGERRELWNIVDRRYEPASEIPDFGQAFTPLKILTRRP